MKTPRKIIMNPESTLAEPPTVDAEPMKAPIYLAGPIFGRADADCKHWRDQAAQLVMLEWPILDPMVRDYRGQEMRAYREVVEGDLSDIAKSWALLVYFDAPSVGTAMEIFNAFWTKKVVVLVNATNSPRLSPWLIFHCHYIVSSVEEAVATLRRVAGLNPGIDHAKKPEPAPTPTAEGMNG